MRTCERCGDPLAHDAGQRARFCRGVECRRARHREGQRQRRARLTKAERQAENRKDYLSRRDHQLAYKRQRYCEHRDQILDQSRDRYWAQRDQIIAYQKRYRVEVNERQRFPIRQPKRKPCSDDEVVDAIELVTAHRHTWDIDSPSGGGVSVGRCRCGAEREFLNSVDTADFNGMKHQGRRESALTAR